MIFDRRRPRKFTISPSAPAPTAPLAKVAAPVIDPRDLPLPPPSWVQSIRDALECQGASQGLARAITGFFGAMEWEGCPDPTVLVWESYGTVSVAFADYASEKCGFLFRGRLDVAIRRENRCGRVEMTPPMRLGWAAIDQGRQMLWQLWRCGDPGKEWDFDLPGVNDAREPVRLDTKEGSAER